MGTDNSGSMIIDLQFATWTVFDFTTMENARILSDCIRQSLEINLTSVITRSINSTGRRVGLISMIQVAFAQTKYKIASLVSPS